MIISDSAIFQPDKCEMIRLYSTSDKPTRSLYIRYFGHLSYPLQLYDLSHCPKWRIQFGPCNWSATCNKIVAGTQPALSESFSSSWREVSVRLKTTSSVPSYEKRRSVWFDLKLMKLCNILFQKYENQFSKMRNDYGLRNDYGWHWDRSRFPEVFRRFTTTTFLGFRLPGTFIWSVQFNAISKLHQLLVQHRAQSV